MSWILNGFHDTPLRPYNRAVNTAQHPATRSALLLACCVALLGGCAALPDNTVAELLDERTGTTVTRMERPIELVSTEPRGGSTDPFAFVAPFETNRMGQRQLYLWVAVPDERGGARPPTVFAGAEALSLVPRGPDAKAVSLAEFPYTKPAPWSAVHAYSIDEAALRSLAAAGTIDITVRYADDREIRFRGSPRPADILQKFLSKLGL